MKKILKRWKLKYTIFGVQNEFLKILSGVILDFKMYTHYIFKLLSGS